MKAALWLRVSTGEQDLEKDRTVLRAFAAGLGMGEIVAEYAVHASAWTGEHNAELDRMIADAAAGSFDVLLITALDRLSREGGDVSMTVVKRLAACGVRIRSIADPELGGALGFGERIGILVKGELAHEQSAYKSLAVKRGMERAKANGKHIGRPKGRRDGPGVRRDRDGYRLREARARVERLRAKGDQKRVRTKKG